MVEIKWTEKASSNLENIHNFIAKDSPIFATEFIRNLVKSTEILERYPKIGRIVPELKEYEFRELIKKSYRIVYRILEKNMNIEILAIIHSSRDLKLDIIDEK